MAKKPSKGSMRGDILRLMSSVPEGPSLFNMLIGLGDEFWTDDPAKDRTAAIMAGSFLEHALKTAIIRHLKTDEDDPNFNYLFASPEAPYREFAGRVRLARALGIITKNEYEQIEAIRQIRNAFAHTMSEVTFATPEIAVFFDELDVLSDADQFNTLLTAFAPKYTVLGMIYNGRANRMAFVHAIFLFYWKLINYPSTNELAKLMKLLRLASP